jgi:APA family basic amino acid/polyamine antiporter
MTGIAADPPAQAARPLGFWNVWALTVGTMIGSGIFALPGVLASYGSLSLGGWALTGIGSILVALTLGRLATRTRRTGGTYVYVRDAFGDLPGFLIAWGYWNSMCNGAAAIAVAFVGYLTVFVPALSANVTAQAAVALGLIWLFTIVAIRGIRDVGAVQILMTLLKLVPLVAVIGLGLVAGDAGNMPAFNPTEGAPVSVLAATALLTLWAFLGLETGAVPAAGIADPERTIPRAIVAGTIVVTVVYIAATIAVMRLVPAAALTASTSPFADAASAFGAFGPALVAAGALVATAGAINGSVFIAGQMPMAVALDGLAPRWLAATNRRGAPVAALVISGVIASAALLANYTRGLMGAFTFMAMISTLSTLMPFLFSAAAELRWSWTSSRGWLAIAALAGLYSLFAIVGAGVEIFAWGMGLLLAGVPVFYLGRERGLQNRRGDVVVDR